jgi:hypothetical protein
VDDRQFDAVARGVGASVSRRGMLRRALGGVLAGTFGVAALDGAEGKNTTKCKPKCKKGYRCHKRKCIKRPPPECSAGLGDFCNNTGDCCGRDDVCFQNGCDGRVCCRTFGSQCEHDCDCCDAYNCEGGTCF